MRFLLFCYICLLLLYAPVSARAEEAVTLTLVADPWCPYTCGEQDANKGTMIEIAEAAFALQGIKVNYKVIPWARALEMVRAGKYDAVVGATKNDAPDFVFPSNEQGLQSMMFWVKKDATWEYHALADLDAINMGVIQGYTYGKVVDDYVQKNMENKVKLQVMSGDTALKLNIRKLLAGRIDVLPEEASVIRYYFQSNGVDFPLKSAGMVSEKDSIESRALYVAFSPANKNAQKYAAILSDGMKMLRESGKLAAILYRYGLQDWVDKTHGVRE